MPDWLKRTLKTFFQAAIPVLIAEHTAITQQILTYDWSNVWAYVLPVLISAAAAGICAVWNLILEYLNRKEEKEI